MKKFNLGIIGCGNMASAIIRALTADTTKHFMRTNGIRLFVSVSDPDMEKLDAVRSSDVKTYTDNRELVNSSDIVLLAVKPQIAENVMNGLEFGGKIVMSIMAGVTLSRLKEYTHGACEKLVRVMPNLNAKIGYSVNAYCYEGLTDDEHELIVAVLSRFGEYYKVREDMMSAVTGISGSGPAFVFMFIDAFIKKGIECGFTPEAAKELVLATMLGCVENVRAYDSDLATLVDSVCSKGGTTIEGVDHLKSCAFEDTVKEAIDRAIKRSVELETNR